MSLSCSYERLQATDQPRLLASRLNSSASRVLPMPVSPLSSKKCRGTPCGYPAGGCPVGGYPAGKCPGAGCSPRIYCTGKIFMCHTPIGQFEQQTDPVSLVYLTQRKHPFKVPF